LAVKILNSIKFDNVIEVGCGLCDVLTRIKANNKIGIDQDKNVIKACKFINFKDIHFINNSFLEVINLEKYFNFKDKEKNLLICINWPHLYEWKTLSNLIKEFSMRNNINYVFIDLITQDLNNNYPYHHTKDQLSTIGDIKIIREVPNSSRALCLIKL
tara:strand:- start:111 stop:584 length:474 start_codon:yes stop_codon:yes gene_type:complete